jgi:putative phage-type endonuclease
MEFTIKKTTKLDVLLFQLYKKYPQYSNDVYRYVMDYLLTQQESVADNKNNILELQVQSLKDYVSNIHKSETNRKRVEYILNKPQPAQRSPAWYTLRKNMFTASSDIGVISGDSYDHKRAKSKEEKDHLIDILILKKNANDLKGFKGNDVTRWGQKYEEIVNKIYEVKTNTKVIEFGLIQHDKHTFIGASPDGISAMGIMIEIKCPQMRKITGIVPRYYWSQMQVQLEVCDLDECDFVEAVFKEFPNESELFEDIMCEYKGIIGEMFKCDCFKDPDECNCYDNPDNRDFIYPDITKNNTQQRKEIKHQFERKYISTLKFKRHIYWGMKEYSNVKVLRDTEWWAVNIPKITETWERVMYYRNNPVELEELLVKTRTTMNNTPDPYKKPTIKYTDVFSDSTDSDES